MESVRLSALRTIVLMHARNLAGMVESFTDFGLCRLLVRNTLDFWVYRLLLSYTFLRAFTRSGWTVRLPWTPGCYGAFEDKQRILQFHNGFSPFILVAFSGSVIRQLHQKNEPWKKKQY
jgi:hypothetical protein